MQIIDELEPVKRGGYGGAVGYLSYAGDLDTAIHIRTVVVKDGVAHVQAGGGTVADAKPDYEYEESVAKAQRRAARDRAGRASSRTGHDEVLVIDNYDSFTYNLVQYLGELGAEVEVGAQRPRDASTSCSTRGYERCVVSPGPVHARTRRASRSRSCAASRRPGIPMLGVCLGHQALAQAFGGSVDAATRRCTARRRRSSTTAARSSPACRAR